MITLIIDTSTDFSILALAQNDSLMAEYPLPVGRQSQVILPSIEGFLKCHQLTLKDLEAIAVGTGPGTFTGTRIGVTIAKTLAYALDIPVLPFCSLLTLPKKPGAIPVFDAKAGQVYAFDESPKLIKLKELLNTKAVSPHVVELQKESDPTMQWHSAQPCAKKTASFLSSLKKVPAVQIEVTYLRHP